jgi:hypothetical protein
MAAITSNLKAAIFFPARVNTPLIFYFLTQRDLKSAIACSRVAEYPQFSNDGGISRAVIVQNHGRGTAS